MRISVSSGDRHVTVSVKGNSPQMLRQAERTARRLLAAGLLPAQDPKPFGFAAVPPPEPSSE